MSSDTQSGLGRREFLGLAPALALFPATRASAAEEPPNVGVGYWLDSPEGEGRVVVPDRSLVRDAELSDRSARISVRGWMASGGGELRSLELWAHFRIATAEGSGLAPAHVWSFQHGTVPQQSAPVSFRAPVDPESGVLLSVSRKDGYASALVGRLASSLGFGEASTHTPCRFTVQGGEDSHRLRRGLYFLAGPCRSTGRLPDWRSYRYTVAEDGTGPRQLWRAALGRLRPVDFDYLTIDIRPESSEPPATVFV
jgi:hypothetical protein